MRIKLRLSIMVIKSKNICILKLLYFKFTVNNRVLFLA